MSFYNMLNKMNMDAVVILSCYLNKRVDQDFPRFRDVFTKDDDCPVKDYDFLIYTRMGGGNRGCWENGKIDCSCPACLSDKLEKEPYVIGRYDDDFDCTYSTFIIKLSEEQKAISPEELGKRFKKLFKDTKKPQEEIV